MSNPCPSCGTEPAPDDRFCGNCGGSLAPATAPTGSPNAAGKPSGGLDRGVIAAAILIAAIIAAVALNAYRGDQSDVGSYSSNSGYDSRYDEERDSASDDQTAVTDADADTSSYSADKNPPSYSLASPQKNQPASSTKGWLGVKIQNVDADIASSVGLSSTNGALVTEITSGGPAESAGIQRGDIVLEVNINSVEDAADFARKISEAGASTPIILAIWRAEERIFLPVLLGSAPATTGQD